MSSTVINLAETAVKNAMEARLGKLGKPPAVYVADRSDVKGERPFIVIHGETATETVAPKSGIFEVLIQIQYESLIKEAKKANRDAVWEIVMGIAYENSETVLSALNGFHCYGLVPEVLRMVVSPETKTFIYQTSWRIVCMPRNNT